MRVWWEATCKSADIIDLHFHDIRVTTVTMPADAGCTLPEIVSITGHTLRWAQDILDKYPARAGKLAERHCKARERDSNRFCKTGCKMRPGERVKYWRASPNKTANSYIIEIAI